MRITRAITQARRRPPTAARDLAFRSAPRPDGARCPALRVMPVLRPAAYAWTWPGGAPGRSV